jgi:hypothetical protein
MSNRSSRWVPPHPRKTIQPKPPTGERVESVKDVVVRCLWADCQSGLDPLIQVPLCKHHAWRAHAAYSDWLETEKRAATAKLNAGLRLDPGERVPGWVYYIEIDGTIKIGYTANIYTRMRAYPPTAKLLAAEPGTKNTERARHSIFGAHLAHGREWFNDHPDIRTWINRLIAEYGDPSHMAYEYTKPEPERGPTIGTRRIKTRYA